MFTVEIKINGALIGHIYGKNVGENNSGKSLYDYEYYEPETRKITCGRVKHERAKGVRPLVAAILNDVTKTA